MSQVLSVAGLRCLRHLTVYDSFASGSAFAPARPATLQAAPAVRLAVTDLDELRQACPTLRPSGRLPIGNDCTMMHIDTCCATVGLSIGRRCWDLQACRQGVDPTELLRRQVREQG